MVEDNGPLMFINTTSTKIEQQNVQKSYDTRFPKVETEMIDNTEDNKVKYSKKLKNILEMYEKGRPVYCKINCGESEFEGVPYKKENNTLDIYVTVETTKQIDINKIDEITIIRF